MRRRIFRPEFPGRPTKQRPSSSRAASPAWMRRCLVEPSASDMSGPCSPAGMKARSYATPVRFGSIDARLWQLINVAQRALLKRTGREKAVHKNSGARKRVSDDVIGRTSRFRKLRFVHIDGEVRQGSDAQQCLRAARLGVCRAHPSGAKCELVLHCNRCCISQEFALLPRLAFRLTIGGGISPSWMGRRSGRR